jgi:formate dehydrogenase maturation protein FdhE
MTDQVLPNVEALECLTIEGEIQLVPSNSWLDDDRISFCPVCGSDIIDSRTAKLQHQLWHYIIASRVLPDKE